MAEFETTVAAALASGFSPGVTPLMYRSATNRLVAPAGLTLVTGAADARTFVEAPGDATNGIDADVTRVPSDPFGLNGDAAVAAGAAGSMQAKFRLMTTLLDAMATSLGLIDNAIASNRVQVDIVSGGLTITRPGTSAVTTPSMSPASSQVIAGNVNRLGLFVDNRTDSALFLRFGATAATLTTYTVRIDPGTTWRDESGWTGAIQGIVDAGGSTANCPVTELTA